MNSKSISPVIATVILVGVAIGAAALLYAWFSGVQGGTQEVGGQTAGRTALATGAAMKIEKVSSEGNVTIKNIGSVNLTSITCTNNDADCGETVAILSPGSKNKSIQCSLSSGINYIECVSDEGALATYQKLK